MSTTRENDDLESTERSPKRRRIEGDAIEQQDVTMENALVQQTPTTEEAVGIDLVKHTSILPPSHVLLGTAPAFGEDGSLRIRETDVGISEYVGFDVPRIEGIIKQRFTDFLVFEVDLDGNVVRMKTLEKPDSSRRKDDGSKYAKNDPLDTPASQNSAPSKTSNTVPATTTDSTVTGDVYTTAAIAAEDISGAQLTASGPNPAVIASDSNWTERFDIALKPYLSEEVTAKVKTLFLEGAEPPLVSDSGWGGRQVKQSGSVENEGGPGTDEQQPVEGTEPVTDSGRGTRGRDRGRRGGRGGRGGGRPSWREDTRKVLSDPIASKATRTALHQVIRELFNGKLETETDLSVPATDEGSRIAIKWSKRGGGRGGRGGGMGRGSGGSNDSSERQSYPPYIHFTLQKTNRDTQDALAHLSRSLHCTAKDLSVAGTKDKRGVTVQRVSLKRGSKLVEQVWKLANGVGPRRTAEEAVTQRGERGIRVADFKYSRASLELGMLKGNAFVITLRNVVVDSQETLARAMATIKTKGFINYYGMQRFGTASIPTHSVGLALLKSDWHKAVSLILSKRPGEHPDVEAARDAWLVDRDLDRALEMMPRRVVAERCILESYKKQGGETRNAMGALSTIPRNLRLMYVHAYQSYVWNAIVSERIRMHGADKPVAGDLILDTETEDDAGIPEADLNEDRIEVEDDEQKPAADDIETVKSSSAKANRRSRKPWEPPKVRILTEADLHKYTIFDVIMPLPGRDVSFPGGSLGERYREFLKLDGLDPDNFERKQREYSLGGSYRKILHLPKELSWSVLKYTDPDVALAQADEDKLLGFDPPAIAEDGKFMALQLQLQLGTAAYATMALREVTKTETSSYFQTMLTQSSEDQKYKASSENADAEMGES